MQKIEPFYTDPAGLKAGWGIGRSTCYELLAAGKLRSVNLRQPGRVRGKRLIEVASIRELLASCDGSIDPALQEQLRFAAARSAESRRESREKPAR